MSQLIILIISNQDNYNVSKEYGRLVNSLFDFIDLFPKYQKLNFGESNGTFIENE